MANNSTMALLWVCLFLSLSSCDNSSDNPPAYESCYEVVSSWPNLPNNLLLGEVTGVGVDSHNHVYIVHRGPNNDPSAADTILKIDSVTGVLISSWGRGLFAIPHGLSVDHDDNVWVTDIAQHQIYKFSHDGYLISTLGIKDSPGLNQNQFDGPTDVEVDVNGNIFVSDGYGNNRITKFDSQGVFQLSWGEYGSGLGEFNIPHGLTISSNIIYVADRGNARIQLFDTDSNFIIDWESTALGRPWGLASTESYIYVVDGGDPGVTDRSHALKLDAGGVIINKWGHHGERSGEMNLAHDVDVDSLGFVYIGEINGRRIQKFEFTCSS